MDDWGSIERPSEETAERSRGITKAEKLLPLADLAAWARMTPQPKPFFLERFIPQHEVTLLTGIGGSNKSTFGLQLAICSAANLPFLGIRIAAGPTLYLTAEDDDQENHWRAVKICNAAGTNLSSIVGKLQISSIRGDLHNELATFDSERGLQPAATFCQLKATIAATNARLVVLDNVAHLFAGNENDRGQVTAFVNLLNLLCREHDLTIVLIAHPNKAGDSYSGSTAWLNAVRSQIVLERPDERDPDARQFSIGKANYAPMGNPVQFRWHDFALVRDEDLPADMRGQMAVTIQANRENALFLACLAERNKQQRQVSEKLTAANYAPKVFEGMAEAKGLSRKRLEEAMDRLYRMGAIERGFLYRNTAEGKDIEGLREVRARLPETSPETYSGRLRKAAEINRRHTPLS